MGYNGDYSAESIQEQLADSPLFTIEQTNPGELRLTSNTSSATLTVEDSQSGIATIEFESGTETVSKNGYYFFEEIEDTVARYFR